MSEGERHSRQQLTGQISEGHPAQFVHEQTTHFACADAEGTVVSVTQTLGEPFGSGFAVPGTGLVLNNILKWIGPRPRLPERRCGPGKKAGTMMSPTQVFRDGAFALSIGTPGSYGILQTQPQMLLNALEFGLNVQEAIEAPRIRVYRDRLLDAESRIPEDDPRGAGRARGTRSTCIDDWSWVVGGGQGIVRDPESGALMAGADPRRDGYALAPYSGTASRSARSWAIRGVDVSLAGRVAVVTGAGSGLGRGIALALAAQGARVAAVDIDEATAKETAALIAESGRAAPSRCARTPARAEDVDRAVDGGGEGAGPARDHGQQRRHPRRLLRRGRDGARRCGAGPSTSTSPASSSAASVRSREMLPRGRGRIVNMASVAGLNGTGGGAAYVAAKHGVVGLTRQMAVTYSARGITVNCDLPRARSSPTCAGTRSRSSAPTCPT